MNYVKETLQRQSGLWLAFFGGSEEIDAAEPERRKMARQERIDEGELLRRELRMRQEADGEAPADATAEEPAGEFRRENSETGAQQELLLRGREKILRELAFQRTAEEEERGNGRERKAAQAEQADPETARWEAEAALREGRNDLETADARAISRRFERDARRYDGGFIFY